MTQQEQLAQRLFPQEAAAPADYERRYPPRNLKEGARVTRFAPSPTGYLHIGNLFSAMIDQLTARATGGRFLLRIEDTDKKREVADGISIMLQGLDAFGLKPDEGVLAPGTEQGDYGPYQQSHRKEIYHAVACRLVRENLAYPCFCTPEELEEIRARQEEAGVNKGYYGSWAKWRDADFSAVQAQLDAGTPWVLRLRSPGEETKKVFFDDLVKGKIEMPENVQDIVLLKTDGIPTYHFAHVVDDHFMRVTHVVRGDEWIASAPVHLQLFQACGFKPPKYVHIAPLMKEEEGGKRKISKRKDPEAAVSYYIREGYPAAGVLEYLMTIANSNFEDWRRANPEAPQSDFPFNPKKMSVSGALFDLVKLNDVSKNVISRMPASAVYEQALCWARQYDFTLASLLEADPDYGKAIFAIDRGGKKPRKDLAKWSEVKAFLAYFYESLWQRDYSLPEHLTADFAADVLKAYREAYRPEEDKEAWFNRIKSLCEPLGCTPNVKEYKKNPEAYRGHVGDVSTVIRVAVTGRLNTPDLYEILRLLGEKEVQKRLSGALAHYEEEK